MLSDSALGAREDLLDTLDIASLVPDAYAAYRSLVVDALFFFLERLPPHRRSAMFAEQAAFPTHTDAATRLVELMHHCPTLHKLGQVLSRDRRLAPEFRHQLQRLESIVPRTSLSAVRSIIEHDLGDPASLGIRLGDEVLAEASVAAVVPFDGPTTQDGGPARGVFKVLKPGIVDRLHEELDIWSHLGAFLDEESARLNLPAIDYQETLDSVRELLLGEVRLDDEQKHLTAARAAYAGIADVVIPDLFPFCSPRITAMRRIDGRKVTALEHDAPAIRARVARMIVDALIAHPFWSADHDAIFHADPHAGNLWVTDDQRLAILDWSLVGTLRKEARVALTRLLIGAVTLNGPIVERAITDLAIGGADRPHLTAVIAESLDEVRRGRLPGLMWVTRLLDQCVLRARVRFDPQWLLFRKSLHVLEGVLADTDASCLADDVLLQGAFGRFMREWTTRFFAAPFDQSFATHLSNADLWSLWWTAPLNFMRPR